VLIELINQAFK